MLRTLTESEFINLLKEKGLIPNQEFSSFKQVSGILKWNLPEVREAFLSCGFDLKDSIPEIETSIVERVPLDILRKERLVPFKEEENSVLVATDNPFNYLGLKKVEWFFSKPLKVVVVPFDEITNFFSSQEETTREVEESSYGEDILSSEEEAPAVKFINDILTLAVRAKASDIHFEPFKNKMRVRIRIDGVLKTVRELPSSKIPAVVSRLKIMANLDIAEKRLPQDGRIMIRLGGKEIDIRVSTLPTYFGERVVLRLLSKESVLYSTRELGLLPEDYEKFEKLIKNPHGIILVTGPTGSGKTTTLYASLSELNSEEINIVTVEDPVEYQLDGISQVQVKPDIGLTFVSALRSILRQDPDIIMIGEIRDTETAEIAIQSALTGHLVFSTLHTNDAPSSVTRLLDMGIEPFLVASSVIGVIAQRLVRKVCPYCKEAYTPTPEELRDLGINDYGGKFYRGRGCEYCMGTGYLGRTAIYEILTVDKDIRRYILSGKDSDEIKELAVKKGMKTLRMDGAEKVKMGVTTPEEVLRVTRG
ncbi:general secretion pathway protein E/type IV pilus assembly protein PilB [Balnearium lithotrophicum]|uniref:protein-secreting ATPase n=1 Tax=Balnearium lithotrophicum TaxID=223788 RepID=A0A521CZG4_9BACT|nr:type II secretion system ATPase GspE [Balnearium lithotrophicum]SMO64798.1 general secretion pathway protein E/type IV pilus assembly protein PilB [Balnearium lithotrophicum]